MYQVKVVAYHTKRGGIHDAGDDSGGHPGS